MKKSNERRERDFKERIERLSRDAAACSKNVETALGELASVKSALSSIVKELARIKEMLADQNGLTEQKLDAIGDGLEIMEEELSEKRKKAEERSPGKESEYLSQLQYLRADFENYKRFVEREKCELGDRLCECFMLDLLPIRESLEVAVDHAKATGNSAGLLEGVALTLKQLMELMKREGLEEIQADGMQFDPFRHEVLARVPAEEGEAGNSVREVLRKGFVFRGKVIRPALVKIAVSEEEAAPDVT
ncbi:MAG TPA: nucleotide exchange factor GrpE [Methanomicrobia archaeon]|nr:nucleotide exchange factor GrpE [Methanomicrobia archaeon]